MAKRDKKQTIPLKEKAIALLSSGVRPGVICKKIKISRETLSRWRAEPEFKTALEEAVAACVADIREETRSLARLAFRSLRVAMQGENQTAAVRAACEVLRTLGALRDFNPMEGKSSKQVHKVEFGSIKVDVGALDQMLSDNPSETTNDNPV